MKGTLLLLFIVSVVFVVCVGASSMYSPPQSAYYDTGNQQLRDAVDGAIIRLRATREFSQIIRFTGVLQDSLCTYSRENYEEEYPFPANPAGTLLAALERGYLLITRPGPDAQMPVGDWTQNPPSGPLPDLARAIARIIGENYSINFTVEYVFTNPAQGSDATYNTLLSGAADMADADYSIPGTITADNRTVARRQIIQFSCPVVTSAISLVFNLDLNVATIDQLQTDALNDSSLIIAVFGTASASFAQSAFPTNQIIDYTTFGSNSLTQLATDLRSGKVQIVWNFRLTDVARFAPDLDGKFGQFQTEVRNLVGYQYRIDKYAPGYSCPSPSPSPSPCSNPCDNPCGGADTNINFDFSGFAARYS